MNHWSDYAAAAVRVLVAAMQQSTGSLKQQSTVKKKKKKNSQQCKFYMFSQRKQVWVREDFREQLLRYYHISESAE
jgi:hypothetical protein